MKITLQNQLGYEHYDRGSSSDDCPFGCGAGELALAVRGFPYMKGFEGEVCQMLGVNLSELINNNDNCEDRFERAQILKRTLESAGHEVELVEMEI